MQAAILLLNEDPEQFPYAERPEKDHHRPNGYNAARQVIVSALRSKKIKGISEWQTETRYILDSQEPYEAPIEGLICAERSTINDQRSTWRA